MIWPTMAEVLRLEWREQELTALLSNVEGNAKSTLQLAIEAR